MLHIKKYHILRTRPWTRHGLVLFLAGLVYIGVGITYIQTGSEERLQGLKLALMWMPLDGWGLVWILVGLLAILSTRWPPTAKTWGYSIMSALATAWACFYFVGVAFMGAPGNQIHSVLTWGLIAILWWAISGLFAPEDLEE